MKSVNFGNAYVNWAFSALETGISTFLQVRVQPLWHMAVFSSAPSTKKGTGSLRFLFSYLVRQLEEMEQKER